MLNSTRSKWFTSSEFPNGAYSNTHITLFIIDVNIKFPFVNRKTDFLIRGWQVALVQVDLVLFSHRIDDYHLSDVWIESICVGRDEHGRGGRAERRSEAHVLNHKHHSARVEFFDFSELRHRAISDIDSSERVESELRVDPRGEAEFWLPRIAVLVALQLDFE